MQFPTSKILLEIQCLDSPRKANQIYQPNSAIYIVLKILS